MRTALCPGSRSTRHRCLALFATTLAVASVGCSQKSELANEPPSSRKTPGAGDSRPVSTREGESGEEPATPKAIEGGVTSENLERFLPETIRGASRRIVDERSLGGRPVPEGFAAASYELQDGQGRRFVNINLQKVVDLAFDKAQFRVGAGEERESAGSAYRGRTIGGRLAQRSFSHNMGSSEVIMLLEDAISVTVSVEKAAHPDEGFEIVELLDLERLAALAQ